MVLEHNGLDRLWKGSLTFQVKTLIVTFDLIKLLATAQAHS